MVISSHGKQEVPGIARSHSLTSTAPKKLTKTDYYTPIHQPITQCETVQELLHLSEEATWVDIHNQHLWPWCMYEGSTFGMEVSWQIIRSTSLYLDLFTRKWTTLACLLIIRREAPGMQRYYWKLGWQKKVVWSIFFPDKHLLKPYSALQPLLQLWTDFCLMCSWKKRKLKFVLKLFLTQF